MARRAMLSKKLEIDSGHRVPDHRSKCKNLHGHRYTIIATCTGDVINEKNNPENGMVIDFGNIKQFMEDIFDGLFDHGFIISKDDDELLDCFFSTPEKENAKKQVYQIEKRLEEYIDMIKNNKFDKLFRIEPTKISNQVPWKFTVVDYPPTAENIAAHMYEMLSGVIEEAYRTNGVRLDNIRLYETPNGFVDYPGYSTL